MGNCLISIHATGAHHNGVDYDIDQLAYEFVDLLKTKGHNVTFAALVSGGETDLMNSGSRMPLKSEK